eukprot:TRINITY_DN7881_c0_g1_i2.p1 TRINITY_DN7881_c0_g1~~TRINITY_DN7881_c0_g1_i2.p1  ORF type:complete len:195 (+),score=23.85 TRINITY_DN7881_c0_g1_i2:55-639(+)
MYSWRNIRWENWYLIFLKIIHFLNSPILLAMSIKFISGQFLDQYDPTIEDSYTRNMDIDNIPCVINIQDTSGQDEFLLLRSGWINESDAFILVYSIDNQKSYNEITNIYQDVMKVKQKKQIIALAANKCDIQKRSVSKEKGLELSKKFSLEYFECSAKDNVNIECIFVYCAREIRKYRSENMSVNKNKGICNLL